MNTKIGDFYLPVSELRPGRTPERKAPEHFRGDIPWVTSGELNFNTITSTIESITTKAVKDNNLKIYPAGTILIAITGLEAAKTRGRCARLGVPATTNQSCLPLPQNKNVDPGFLFQFYLLHGEQFAFRFSQGTKQQNFNTDIVRELPLLLPPLPEQQKIVAILTSIDKVINNIQKKIDKLQYLKKATMNELLTKGIGHTEFKESELGRIPKSWVVTKLGDECEVRGGKRLPEGSEFSDVVTPYPYIRVSDFRDGTVDTSELKYVSDQTVDISKLKYVSGLAVDTSGLKYVSGQTADTSKLAYVSDQFPGGYNRYIISSDDLYISIAGSIGRVGTIPKQLCGALLTENAAIIHIRDKLIDKYFLSALLSHEKVQSQFDREKGIGGGAAKLALFRIKDVLLSCPGKPEQRYISSIIESISEQITVLDKKLQQTQFLKKSLMQDLLSGKVRVAVN